MNGKILGTVAVAGAVATFALLNVNGPMAGSNFLAATPFSEAERAFINFISEHHRSYGTKEEYQYRLSLFEDAYRRIQEHNSKEGMTYTLGITSIADYSDYEYKQLLGYKKSARTGAKFLVQASSLPDSVDWVSKGGVTGVKDQGQCGSCWSFSTTGSVEGAVYVSTGKLTSLSEQELVDCVPFKDGCMGCNGGSMDGAMTWLQTNPLNTEANYPYKARDGTCALPSTGQKVKSHVDVTSQDPVALMTAVAQQPVSIAIEADQMVFQLYSGGVLTSSKCGTNLDHGVLVVGYGTDSKYGDFWKVKNSWGTSWGEAGYIRMARDSTTKGPGMCGLQMEPVYPVV